MRVITHVSFFLFLFFTSACGTPEFGSSEGAGNVIYARICDPLKEDCTLSFGGTAGTAGAHMSTGGSEHPSTGGESTGGVPTHTSGTSVGTAGDHSNGGETSIGGETSNGGLNVGGISEGGHAAEGGAPTGGLSAGGEPTGGMTLTGGTSPTGGVSTGGVVSTGGAAGMPSEGGAGGDPGPTCDETGIRVRVDRAAAHVNATLTGSGGDDLEPVCSTEDDLDPSPNAFECCITTDWTAGNFTMYVEFLLGNGTSTCSITDCLPYDLYTVWANGNELPRSYGSNPKDVGQTHMLAVYIPTQFQ